MENITDRIYLFIYFSFLHWYKYVQKYDFSRNRGGV